jgi:hypothetical protein
MVPASAVYLLVPVAFSSVSEVSAFLQRAIGAYMICVVVLAFKRLTDAVNDIYAQANSEAARRRPEASGSNAPFLQTWKAYDSAKPP